jgi:hypothetical protein
MLIPVVVAVLAINSSNRLVIMVFVFATELVVVVGAVVVALSTMEDFRFSNNRVSGKYPCYCICTFHPMEERRIIVLAMI